MTPAILAAVVGVLAVVGIYYWWAHVSKPSDAGQPAKAHDHAP